MTRSRASAKAAGTRFATSISAYLATVLGDDRIERRAATGANDRGDVTGLRTILGERLVIEAKDYGGRILAAEWIKEAHVEAANDDAAVGVVVAKRRGTTNPADQWVVMTLQDLAVLLGAEPEREREA